VLARVRPALLAVVLAAALTACTSSKNAPSDTATYPTLITLSPPSSSAAAGSFFGPSRLFAATAGQLCQLVDVSKLGSAVGIDLQPGTVQGSACVFAATNAAGEVILSVQNDMPAAVLDAKLQLDGVSNVTAKEVSVNGAKRAVLQTQTLPSQINQTLIALYDGGGVQLLIGGRNLTDAKAIAAMEAVTGT